MKRSGPIRRLTPLARGKPPKQRNAKRRRSEFARCYHSKARIRFVASLPCAADGNDDRRIPRENAHSQNDGMGRKGHYTTILPLCHRCHHKQHQSGWLAIGMSEEGRRRAAERTEELWQESITRGAYDDGTF